MLEIKKVWSENLLFLANNNSIKIIGIAGGTGSGKTSVANAILAEFSPSEVILIQQDSYYKDLKHLHIDKRATVNFDHPDAVDFNKLGEDLQSIIAGETVEIPIYDYKNSIILIAKSIFVLVTKFSS